MEALARIRAQKRGVEGIHARVTQSLGGRPLSAAGLACELKWGSMEELFQRSPQAVIDFIQHNEQLCAWAGLKEGIEGLLGCRGIPVSGRDKYGELGNFLHRLALAQQTLVSMSIVVVISSHQAATQQHVVSTR